MKSLKDFIINQQAVGKSFFLKKDALRILNITPEQFRYQAYRLSQKGFLRRLALNFYMIVPAEYLNLGTLPPIMFIDHLMRHFNQDYYVGLLVGRFFLWRNSPTTNVLSGDYQKSVQEYCFRSWIDRISCL